LSHIGRVSKEALRCDDFVFRYGGDEFIIILPEANIRDSIKVAEKLRQQVEKVEFRLSRNSKQAIHVSISVGVTEAKATDTPASILTRADKGLYESKSNGRNQVSSVEAF
jgi:diguanylate cyclase (GGDEF)-like protein